jgi:predicted PurR-regulated permease PerM
MQTESSLVKNTYSFIVAILIVMVLVVGKSFLVPLAWALLIGLASYHFLNRVEEKTILPRGFIIMLFLLFIFIIIFALGYFFYIELSHIFNDLPTIIHQVANRLHKLSLSLKDIGITIPDHIDKAYITDWVNKHNDVIFNFVSAFGLNIWDIVLTMFYLFFLLYYRDLIPQFYVHKFKDNEARLDVALERFNKSLTLIRSYIYGLTLITLISAVMNYLVFVVFGLKFGLFFAVFLALLNLIPFIGNPIGLVVIMLFAIITKDNMLIPLFIFIALFVMNFLQDNVIRPWIVGDKLKINAFTVFIAIIIGGMIWGFRA